MFPIVPQDLRNSEMQRNATPTQEAIAGAENTLLQEVAILRERVRSQAVSYTHLDVYKRQSILSSFLYTLTDRKLGSGVADDTA